MQVGGWEIAIQTGFLLQVESQWRRYTQRDLCTCTTVTIIIVAGQVLVLQTHTSHILTHTLTHVTHTLTHTDILLTHTIYMLHSTLSIVNIVR